MDLGMCRERFNKCLAHSGLAMDPAAAAELLDFIAGLERAHDAGRMAQLASG
jgi:hypothetical protein